jgi:hypothetical protein
MNLDISESSFSMTERTVYLIAIRTYYHHLLAFPSFPPFSFAKIDENRTGREDGQLTTG